MLKKQEKENNRYSQVSQEELFKYSDVYAHIEHLNKEQKKKKKEADAYSKVIEKKKKKLNKLRKKMLLANAGSDEMISFQIERQKILIDINELQFKEQQKRLFIASDNVPAILKLEEISLKRDVANRQKLLELYSGKGLLDEKDETDLFGQQKLIQEKLNRIEEIHGIYDRLLKLTETNKKLQEKKEDAKAQTDEARENAEISFINSFLEEEYPDSSKLEYQYITSNIEECLERVRRIQRALQTKHVPGKLSKERAAAFQEKAASLKDYIWHVRECFLADGVDILCDSLRLYSEKPENISGRRKYLAGGYLRLLQLKDQEKIDNSTDVDSRFRQLEGALKLQADKNMEIANQITRKKPEAGQEKVREAKEIRAGFSDVVGSMDRFYEKLRIFQIYEEMKKQLKEQGEKACLTEFEDELYKYIGMFQKINEGRQKHAAKEEKAYTILMEKMKKASLKSAGQARSYIMMLESLLVGNSNGSLEVPAQCEQVVYKDRDIQKNTITGINVWNDRKNRPLFLHTPCIKDLKQGEVGDCYLLAGLGSVVASSPDLIRQLMRDNGDGTVTVRFFRNKEDDGTDEPLYVTVKKTVPKNIVTQGDEYARGCLWVQMIEKAYAVSGIHSNAVTGKQKKKNTPGYDGISGGHLCFFLRHLLGSSDTIFYDMKGNVKTINYGIEAAKLLNAIPIEKAPILQQGQAMSRIAIEKYLMVLAEIAAEDGVSLSSIKNEKKLRKNLQKYSKIMKRYAEETEKSGKPVNEAMKKYEKFKLNEENLTKLVDVLCDGLDKKMAPADDTIELYSQVEMAAYNDITKALHDHKYVMFGTKKLGLLKLGKNGETESSGMVGTHAYTVLRTEEIKIAGKVHRYLVLFNPWTEGGITYKLDKNNSIKKGKSTNKDEGIFYLELRDALAKYADSYEIASQGKGI